MPQGIVHNHLSNKTLSKCLPLTTGKLESLHKGIVFDHEEKWKCVYMLCIATLSYVKEANFERPPIKYVYIKEESTKDKSIYRSGSVAGIKIYK